jgi:hypothetical protein
MTGIRLTEGSTLSQRFDTMSIKSHRPPKSRRYTPPITTEHLLRAVLQKNPNPPTLSDAEKEQLFQEFLEWRKRQTEVP